MTTRAAEDSLDHLTWTSEKYGCQARSDIVPETEVADGSKPESSSFNGDRVLGNNINFMRNSFLYLETTYATAEGDQGRINEAIKVFPPFHH